MWPMACARSRRKGEHDRAKQTRISTLGRKRRRHYRHRSHRSFGGSSPLATPPPRAIGWRPFDQPRLRRTCPRSPCRPVDTGSATTAECPIRGTAPLSPTPKSSAYGQTRLLVRHDCAPRIGGYRFRRPRRFCGWAFGYHVPDGCAAVRASVRVGHVHSGSNSDQQPATNHSPPISPTGSNTGCRVHWHGSQHADTVRHSPIGHTTRRLLKQS
jgi:hypothetical protein